MFTIRLGAFPDDVDAILAIWREFIANAPVDLSYQNNEAEFANLSGKYAKPNGCVLLAEVAGEIMGCIALRKVDNEICEMKRLYVRALARGSRIGHALVGRLIEEARSMGYRELRLDVMEKYYAARRLYRELGFTPAEPVTYNPVPGAEFLGLRL